VEIVSPGFTPIGRSNGKINCAQCVGGALGEFVSSIPEPKAARNHAVSPDNSPWRLTRKTGAPRDGTTLG